jgi:hypothetical protein
VVAESDADVGVVVELRHMHNHSCTTKVVN